MSKCVRGLLNFRLLTMTFIGACLCMTNASTIVENGGVNNSKNHKGSSSLDGATLWRDWLLTEDTQPSPSDTNSGLLVRRITPKSVFVAPSFSGCSEGYRQDGMGRCVKLVKVNQAAQLDFLLQKLNSMYAPSNLNKNKNDNKGSSGPFHVSLPLGSTLNNNNNTLIDKDTLTTVSTTSKTTTDTTNKTTLLSFNVNSKTNTNRKKTEFLYNISINLPLNMTNSSQFTSIEPQNNNETTTTTTTTTTITNNNNNNNINTTNSIETTTDISNTNLDNLTTFRPPVEPSEENQRVSSQSNFNTTVKREPQIDNNYNNSYNEKIDLNNSKKQPFVIIVNNSSYNLFDTTTPSTTININTEETIPFIFYESSTLTTNKDVQTTTENILQDTTSFSTVYNNFNSDTMETITMEYDNFSSTVLSTTTTINSSLSNNEEFPSTLSTTTTETTPFESFNYETLTENSKYFNTHSVTTNVPNTTIADFDLEGGVVNEEEEEEEDLDSDDEEDTKINEDNASEIFGDFIRLDTLSNNKNIRESSKIQSSIAPGASSVPFNPPEIIKTKCIYNGQATGLDYGKIIYGNSNVNCDPEVTTIRYPVRTTTSKPLQQSSYYVRFPVDTLNLSPASSSLSSSSSSSLSSGYKKPNSFVRFPEQPSSSTYISSSFGTKVINSDSSSVSPTMWYPQSWFPFIQPHRTWQSNDDNDNNNNMYKNQQTSLHQPMSTVYHKQYHNQHTLPQNVPSWINTHSTWSQRD